MLSSMARILIVEKNEQMLKHLRNLLLTNGYEVRGTPDGLEALNLVEENFFDLVLLSWKTESISGESVCLEIVRRNPGLPVILILDETGDPESVAKKFSCGAEDVVFKPIDDNRLLARVRTRLIGDVGVGMEFKADDLVLDPKRITVSRGGKSVELTPQEFKLLKYLMQNKGRVLSRDMILSKVWAFESEVQTRVVDVYVGYLREKIDNGHKKKLIYTVRGFGYKIDDK